MLQISRSISSSFFVVRVNLRFGVNESKTQEEYIIRNKNSCNLKWKTCKLLGSLLDSDDDDSWYTSCIESF